MLQDYSHKTKKESGCGCVSFQAQQLHVEDEGGVGRDDARVAFGSVGIVGGAGQLGPLTDAHLGRGVGGLDRRQEGTARRHVRR